MVTFMDNFGGREDGGPRSAGRAGAHALRDRVVALLIKVGVWAAVLALVIVFGVGSARLAKRVFLTENPHFTLKHIEVKVNGQLRPAEVIARLSRLKVKPKEVNLFALDLARLRRDLGAFVMVSQADLHLKLPSTLVIEISERIPVAQLVRHGERLVDPDGWIMPPRNDSRQQSLPVIIGLRNLPTLQTGARATDDMLLNALNLLRLLAIRPCGRLFDVEAVQLDYGHGTFRLHLRQKGTFRTGAQIVLPARPLELEESLQRVEIIARERTRGQQITGFINGTYRVNVPVLP